MATKRTAPRPKPLAPTAATKRAQARKKKPPRRPEGHTGPEPVVLHGFNRAAVEAAVTAAEHPDTDPGDPALWWAERAPAQRVLDALRTGASWSLASDVTRLHEATPRLWNSRGKDAHDAGATLSEYIAGRVDDETLSYLAFHLSVLEAQATPGVLALGTISRVARQRENLHASLRAATVLLRTNPRTRSEYAEITKLEHSGPDGGAIPVEERAATLAARLRERAAAGKPAPGDGEEVEDDGAGEG